MIKAKTYPDFKEFVKVFIANVKLVRDMILEHIKRLFYRLPIVRIGLKLILQKLRSLTTNQTTKSHLVMSCFTASVLK